MCRCWANISLVTVLVYGGRSIWPQWPMGLVKHSFARVTGTRVTVTIRPCIIALSATRRGERWRHAAGWPRARRVFERLFQSAAWRRSFMRHTGAILREKNTQEINKRNSSEWSFVFFFFVAERGTHRPPTVSRHTTWSSSPCLTT